jgi:hypothetical protein
MSIARETSLKLFDLWLVGTIADIFRRENVEPTAAEMQVLTGEVPATFQNIGLMADRLGQRLTIEITPRTEPEE